MQGHFTERKELLERQYRALIQKPNEAVEITNGVIQRYKNPVLTPAHTPVFWRYDLDIKENPLLLERFGINSVFNAGAIRYEDKYLVAARVEGTDRKSFFAIAESDNGIDNFTFWDYPIDIPDIDPAETNVYDIRLTSHEDGWIYGTFCSERRDEAACEADQSAAIASCGIIRTKDLHTWERLPNLVTASSQQRNVVIHPEFVNGKYAFYTRPQDGFIEAGDGGGIAFACCDDIRDARIDKEEIIDKRVYHTISEAKNGLGPAPVKTACGWLHLAHGVRNTAAGLRYVLYCFMTDLRDPQKIIYKPAGYVMAPEGDERTGDVSNVLFSNGWIKDEDGTIFIYYGCSDTLLKVATTTEERLLDYCMHTPPDRYRSVTSVERLKRIIRKNKTVMQPAPQEK
jgi:4-O-beta-D-mannosyl-D-glucose phosphorylase